MYIKILVCIHTCVFIDMLVCWYIYQNTCITRYSCMGIYPISHNCKLTYMTHSTHPRTPIYSMPRPSPLKDHLRMVKNCVIRLFMRAQWTDEVGRTQTSSVHNSCVQCPMDTCLTILEPLDRGPHGGVIRCPQICHPQKSVMHNSTCDL
jgi:hypothetical protein